MVDWGRAASVSSRGREVCGGVWSVRVDGFIGLDKPLYVTPHPMTCAKQSLGRMGAQNDPHRSVASWAVDSGVWPSQNAKNETTCFCSFSSYHISVASVLSTTNVIVYLLIRSVRFE